MLISSKTSAILQDKINSSHETCCSGLFLSARWFVFSQLASQGFHLVLLPGSEDAEYCASDLYNLLEGDCVFFLPASGKNIERSNHKSSLSVQRTSAIDRILKFSGERLVVVTYPQALEEYIPEREKIRESVLSIKTGDTLSHDSIRESLGASGFEKVDFVSVPGQYAVRGSVVDIFSYACNDPYRLVFWGDEIEKISIFECNTQLSKENVKQIDIYPDISSQENVLQGVPVSSILPRETLLWLDSPDLYIEKEFFAAYTSFRKVFLQPPVSYGGESVKFNLSPQPVFNKNFELLSADLARKAEQGYKLTIYCEKQSQAERLKNILSGNHAVLPEFECGWNIHEGFIDNENKVCCYSDHEIFDRFHRVVLRRTVEKTEQLTLNDLAAFNNGDYIVHIDHGVGIFGGLVKMKDDKGRLHEVVKLSYAGGDTVFVSVHSLHKISRYKSKDSLPPKIHKLGSKTWQTLKKNAKEKVKDIAKELISLYAKRKAVKGFAYSPDNYLQEELESSFMYEDTPDQQLASMAVKKDMEEENPMDRLICGDVGFGKTEIAVRAAFKASCDSKQVAVLVPTTILALQHYNTFSARLKNFPVRVEYVSRLRSAKEISKIREDLAAGKIDILVGTHKILGKDFVFKDLGLLIIDEEQKFGVSAKERLRQLKSSVDTLTLTATPIPRTLQFSLLGARDLSIIGTPPPNRIPVQTEIMLFDESEIKGVIEYELRRRGQLFFLHNKIEELPAVEDILRRLVPDMKICTVHGRMDSRELENKMLDFIQGDYDMLLCTTLIENGLDIPNANTIIINQAQNFGLSDLHQLRGRVGRSNKKAFCYLIVPPLTGISDDARRRLKAIEEFSDLGSGFNIAMQDLDIRGAGNLLGAEQSGFIADMGYETYQKILSEAMEEIGIETGMASRNVNDSFVSDCTIETDFPAYIPDSYIDVNAEKIRIYKELDSARSHAELGDFAKRLEDRFGPMPQELKSLFDVVRIRQTGEQKGFEKIIIKNDIMIAFFISNQMSSFYTGGHFADVIKKATLLGDTFEFKEKDGKLRLIARKVGNLDKAAALLDKL